MAPRLLDPETEPVMYLVGGLNALVALLVAFWPHLSIDEAAAMTTIATGVTTGITALATRPFDVSAITAAVTTCLVATAGFGLHFDPRQLGAIVAALTIVLALVLRQHLTPIKSPRARPS